MKIAALLVITGLTVTKVAIAFAPSRWLLVSNSNVVPGDNFGGRYSLEAASTRQPKPQSRLKSQPMGDSNEEAPAYWNPPLRRTLGGIAALGALETSYLTWTKITRETPSLCDTGGECSSVLSGPYSTLPGTDLPLATLGLVAYSTVAILALSPLLGENRRRDVDSDDDDVDLNNRVALLAVTTSMGLFSVFLMSLLLGVLKETCIYCIGSAVLSISLATLAWFGGVLPQERAREGVLASAGTSIAAFATAILLYTGGDNAASSSTFQLVGSGNMKQQTTLLADSSSSSMGLAPPPITTTSTSRAVSIAEQLQELDTHFYGAYWCSHCYDQKEALGKEAMSKIPYVECSKEGRNPQTQLCKEKKIPGYPTWEIQGKLYPGEQALDELEEIIQTSKHL